VKRRLCVDLALFVGGAMVSVCVGSPAYIGTRGVNVLAKGRGWILYSGGIPMPIQDQG
jgi:hypothetical protein